jgi:hypothetical protein
MPMSISKRFPNLKRVEAKRGLAFINRKRDLK